MVICGNLATFRYPKDLTRLPDVLFSLLPEKKLSPLPEIFLYTLLASAFGRMIFHPDGGAIARRFATISGCVFVVRSIALIATSMPNPQVHCQDYKPSWTASALFSDCGDMMGHTVSLTLAALVWSQYTNYKLLYIVAWLFSSSAMLLFIINRSHYTLDMLISFFISLFIWKYYHMTLLLPLNEQNKLIKWLETLDSGIVGNENQNTIKSDVGGVSILDSPETSKFKELVTSASPSKFIELVEDLSSSSSSSSRYKELAQDKSEA